MKFLLNIEEIKEQIIRGYNRNITYNYDRLTKKYATLHKDGNIVLPGDEPSDKDETDNTTGHEPTSKKKDKKSKKDPSKT